MKIQSTDESRIALIEALHTPALRPEAAPAAAALERAPLPEPANPDSARPDDPGEWLLSLNAWADVPAGARLLQPALPAPVPDASSAAANAEQLSHYVLAALQTA